MEAESGTPDSFSAVQEHWNTPLGRDRFQVDTADLEPSKCEVTGFGIESDHIAKLQVRDPFLLHPTLDGPLAHTVTNCDAMQGVWLAVS